MTLRIILALIVICVAHVGFASPLIDVVNRNGGFETGVMSPWSGGEALFGPTQAYAGSWYASSTAQATRASVFQFFPSPATDHQDFILSFAARTHAEGFANVEGYLSARRADGSFFNAVVLDSDTNVLATTWTEFRYVFRFVELWDVSRSLSVGVNFQDGSSGDVGYLDAVTLVQVPEPRYLASLFPPVLIFCFMRCRSRRSALASPASPSPPATPPSGS